MSRHPRVNKRGLAPLSPPELFEHPAEQSLLVPYVQALEALLRETGFPQPHG
jgi:hypothetical protein